MCFDRYLRTATQEANVERRLPAASPTVSATLMRAAKISKLDLLPGGAFGTPQALSQGDRPDVASPAGQEFYRRLNAATDRIHAALEAGDWVYLHGDDAEAGSAAYAVACVAAYLVRYRDQTPLDAIRSAFEGQGDSKSRSMLSAMLRPYAPVLFSVALFKIGSTNTAGDSTRWFSYYASSAVGFIRDKVATFPGCDFIFHVNEEVGDEIGLLHSMYQQAHGRIEFHEYRFTPRKRIAPWLIAAMRLAPLLDKKWRLVVSADIHDQRELQNTQLKAIFGKLRRLKSEMMITYWLAEDEKEECMIHSPLPVRTSTLASLLRKAAGSSVESAKHLHAHTDAGLLVFRGNQAREAVDRAHKGESFISALSKMVQGANTVPHGIEEMAFDLYLFEADWAVLEPFVQFDVHRSEMVGAGDGVVRADKQTDAGISTDSKLRYDVSVHQIDFDVGVADWQAQLPCCRHSRAFDCEEAAQTTTKPAAAPKKAKPSDNKAGAAEPPSALPAPAASAVAKLPSSNDRGIYARAEYEFHPSLSVTSVTLLPLEAMEPMYVEAGKGDAWVLVIKPNGLRGYVPANHITMFVLDEHNPECMATVAAFQRKAQLSGGGATDADADSGSSSSSSSSSEEEGDDEQDDDDDEEEEEEEDDDEDEEEEEDDTPTESQLWTAAEDAQLRRMVEKEGPGSWHSKADRFDTGRSAGSLKYRWNECLKQAPANTKLSAQSEAKGVPSTASSVKPHARGTSSKATAPPVAKPAAAEPKTVPGAELFSARKAGSFGEWHSFRSIRSVQSKLPIGEYSEAECLKYIDECCRGRRKSFGGYVFRRGRAAATEKGRAKAPEPVAAPAPRRVSRTDLQLTLTSRSASHFLCRLLRFAC